MNKGPKYLKRQPVYLLMFGFMKALESLPGVSQSEGVTLFMKQFELREEDIGIDKDSMLREFRRMQDDFLRKTT